MTNDKSETLFERGRKVLIEGVSSASRGPARWAMLASRCGSPLG